MKLFKNRFVYIFILLIVAVALFYLKSLLAEQYNVWLRIMVVIIILAAGAAFVLRGCAKIIEETTEVLSERTKLAGGLLQSFGTAFPDMILGVMAAIVSLQLRSTNYLQSINFAIIAAATTFGSNIYNIGHAAWCIFRQNLANRKAKPLLMFPGFKKGGMVTPMDSHHVKPSLTEIDIAIDVSTGLTVLTAAVALSMVIFGKIKIPPLGMQGDLYQLVKPISLVIFILAIAILFFFRKTKRSESPIKEIVKEEQYYRRKPNLVIWISLLLSGVAILMVADSMVHAIEAFSEITHVPFVVSGALAGIIGCLGEMIVIHNFSVNSNGRIGDAVVGVAMDNIVTIMGASVVAMLGGVFLGGNALILIFVIIFTLNTLLIWQIARLKNYFLRV